MTRSIGVMARSIDWFDKPLKYKFTAIVNVDDKTYLIDSCDTYDHGYELMVFEVSKHFDDAYEKNFDVPRDGLDDSILTQEVNDATDFADLYAERYGSVEAAEADFDRLRNPEVLKDVLASCDNSWDCD